jgi:hypothetical protein
MATAVSTRRPRALGPRVLGLVAGAAVAILAIVVITGRGDHVSAFAPKPLPPVVTQAGMLDKVGIRIVHVAEAGGGGLLDLRYQVVDVDKAGALHDRGRPPALVDEHSGQVIGRLLMGHAHFGTLHAGVTYYVEFENPGGLVKAGDPVSVVLGPARQQHILVQ